MADAKNAHLSMEKQKSFIILITFKFLLIMTMSRINFSAVSFHLLLEYCMRVVIFIILYPYVMNDKTITFIFITGKIFALNKT